jgi:hypothetical protein
MFQDNERQEYNDLAIQGFQAEYRKVLKQPQAQAQAPAASSSSSLKRKNPA